MSIGHSTNNCGLNQVNVSLNLEKIIESASSVSLRKEKSGWEAGCKKVCTWKQPKEAPKIPKYRQDAAKHPINKKRKRAENVRILEPKFIKRRKNMPPEAEELFTSLVTLSREEKRKLGPSVLNKLTNPELRRVLNINLIDILEQYSQSDLGCVDAKVWQSLTDAECKKLNPGTIQQLSPSVWDGFEKGKLYPFIAGLSVKSRHVLGPEALNLLSSAEQRKELGINAGRIMNNYPVNLLERLEPSVWRSLTPKELQTLDPDCICALPVKILDSFATVEALDYFIKRLSQESKNAIGLYLLNRIADPKRLSCLNIDIVEVLNSYERYVDAEVSCVSSEVWGMLTGEQLHQLEPNVVHFIASKVFKDLHVEGKLSDFVEHLNQAAKHSLPPEALRFLPEQFLNTLDIAHLIDTWKAIANKNGFACLLYDPVRVNTMPALVLSMLTQEVTAGWTSEAIFQLNSKIFEHIDPKLLTARMINILLYKHITADLESENFIISLLIKVSEAEKKKINHNMLLRFFAT